MSKKQKIDYLSYTRENDIPSNARFGYRGMRIAAWIFMLCLVMGAIWGNSIILQLAKNNPFISYGASIFSFFGNLALPAFFIANFSIILANRGKYKTIFLRYILFIGLILLMLYGFLYRYFIQIGTKAFGDSTQAFEGLTSLLNSNPTFAVCFNLFIDLMLCLLAWFFIDYTPKKHFQGKKIVYFRLLALLPIAYEVACITIKLYAICVPAFKVPFYVFPLITNKPPILFFAFLAIAIREKLLERKYSKLGHNREEFLEYCTTNAANKSFTKFCSRTFLIAALVDLVFCVCLSYVLIGRTTNDMNQLTNELIRTGLGKGISLVFMIPLMHFFSYNKKYKSSVFDTLLPLVSIAIIGIVIIEMFIDLLTII